MATVPTPPQITVRPVATTGALEFFWAAPTSDGGSAITGYTLSCTGLTPQSLGASTYSYQYTGLTDGTDYTFNITADNAIGSSTPAVFRTVQPGNKPGPVQGLTPTRTGATTITLSWTAPVSNGGSTIRGYFVKAQSTNAEEAAITRSISNGETFAVLKGLTAGAVYTYTVQAVNDAGYSTAVSTGLYSLVPTWNAVPLTAPEGSVNQWFGIAGDISGTKIVALPSFGNMPLYRSIDGGNTWKDKAVSFPQAFGAYTWRKAACSDDGRVIYVTTSVGNIWVSTDYGQSWTSSLFVSNIVFGTIACSSDGTIAIAARTLASGSIYVTTNTGSSWNAQVTPGSRIWASVCCSTNGQTMMACGSSINIWTSTNGGSTWTERTSISPGFSYNAITCSSDGATAYCVNNSGQIWKSTNSGALWTNIASFNLRNLEGRNFAQVSCSRNGLKVYAAAERGIYRSFNGGTSWDICLRAYNRDSSGPLLTCNIFCTPDGNRLFVSRNLVPNLITSSDSGTTWTPLVNTPRLSSLYSYACSSDGSKMYGVEFGGGTALFCGLWRSTDSGTTWTLNQDATRYKTWRWVCCSADGSFVAATDSTTNAGWVWTSSDSGATWTQQTGAGQRNWRGICCDISGTKLYAADTTGGLLYSSIDSGVTWTALSTAGTRSWRDVKCSADGTKVVAAVQTSGYIYTSTDSGATWTEQTAAGARNWTALACSADFTKILAGINGGLVYLSTDSGTTWSTTSLPSAVYLSLAMNPNGTTMVAPAQAGLDQAHYVSTNSGATWTAQTAIKNQLQQACALSDNASIQIAGGYFNNGPFIYKLWG